MTNATTEKRGIDIPDFDSWKEIPPERIRELSERATSNFFNIRCFFDRIPYGVGLRANGKINLPEIQVASGNRTRGYVIIRPDFPLVRDVSYLDRFLALKKQYSSLGAKIQREFIHDDIGEAGFLWEAQQ
ncbi:hypothetical protein HY450_00515 [Candidatus Pacearchaeota archaeon]|nr:hypothetical protein [Candidatus Pacearchaeota archaeon]